MNIFRIFKTRKAVPPPTWLIPKQHQEPCELDLGTIDYPKASPWGVRIFEPTHVHIITGKLYMLTSDGERLEVTGDDAYPLAEYEDAAGKTYAQRASRFHDGRFREVTL